MGARCRRFESYTPDHFFKEKCAAMVFSKCCYYLKSLWQRRYCHIVRYRGRGNRLIVHLAEGTTLINPRFVAEAKVKFKGNDSTIELFEPYSLSKAKFILGTNDRFVVKGSQGNINVIGGRNAELIIDENSTLQNTKIFMNDESGVKVKIGKGCMFSYDICIWASDTHPIFDKNSGCLLNKSEYGVEIGDDVWCGTRATILKDSKVGTGSVIGAASVVCSRFEESYVVIAGNPARIIKRNIAWQRDGSKFESSTD